MYEEGERQRSVLFRIYKDGDLYSIPIQCITWIIKPMWKVRMTQLNSRVMGVFAKRIVSVLNFAVSAHITPSFSSVSPVPPREA